MTSPQQFYQVLEILDEYDTTITQLNELFGSAMLSLANIRFLNPHSSISPIGFRPSPAMVLYNRTENKLSFTETGEFVKKVNEEDVEFEEQLEIEKDMKALLENKELSEEEKIMSRFGSFLNAREIEQTSKCFRKCLDKILEVGEIKRQTMEKLATMKEPSKKQ